MRVVTYNLLHGLDVRSEQVDLDAAARAIEALGADVVAVQEVDRGLRRTDERDQVAEIAKRLGWHGVFAPAGTPAANLERLEAAARRAAASPRFAERLASDGLEPAPERPRAAFGEAVRAESAFWAQKVRELDLKLE